MCSASRRRLKPPCDNCGQTSRWRRKNLVSVQYFTVTFFKIKNIYYNCLSDSSCQVDRLVLDRYLHQHLICHDFYFQTFIFLSAAAQSRDKVRTEGDDSKTKGFLVKISRLDEELAAAK